MADAREPDLQAVIGVEAEVGGVDGNTCVLTAVDMWSSVAVVQLYWTPESPSMRPMREAAERDELPPKPWSVVDRFTIADDLNTHYEGRGGGIENDRHEALQFWPPPPADATRLIITFEHDHGVTETHIALGDRSTETFQQGGLPTSWAPSGYLGTIAVGAELGSVESERLWLLAVDLLGKCVTPRFAITSPQELAPTEHARVEWSLSDDVDTTYEQGAARGPGGSFWAGRHQRRWFWPSPPQEATLLTVTGQWDGRELQHRVSLDRRP